MIRRLRIFVDDIAAVIARHVFDEINVCFGKESSFNSGSLVNIGAYLVFGMRYHTVREQDVAADWSSWVVILMCGMFTILI